MNSKVIENVSDTARWVAMYRAQESERADALFSDPYARRLAGPKGEDVIARMPKAKRMAWPMIVRTAVMDEILLRTLPEIDAVVNLAAGLDARPWRLALPPSLRWYDVDLPGISEYKREALAAETPRCQLEWCPCDLSDPLARQALFRRLGAETQRLFVISEGLLVYLTPENVAELAGELRSLADARWWMTDLATPRLVAMLEKTWGATLQQGAAPFRFAPEEGTNWFQPFGWKEAEWRSSLMESVRLKRTFALAPLFLLLSKFSSAKKREEGARMAGIALLGAS